MMKVRLKFYKTGSLKFIGHLDIMRYFQKAIRRSGLPVSYSKGFSPHQIISFASPLGVGSTSNGEYMDMQMETFVEPEEIKDRLNATMSEEMQIVDACCLPEDSKTSMALLAAADYLISQRDGYDRVADFENRFQSFISRETIPVMKKTKKSEQEIDLARYVYAVCFTREAWEEKTGHPVEIGAAERYENGQVVYLQLACGSVHNIKPDFIMEEFCKYAGLAFCPFAYQIHRIEMYTDQNASVGEANLNGSGRERRLVPLYRLGVNAVQTSGK